MMILSYFFPCVLFLHVLKLSSTLQSSRSNDWVFMTPVEERLYYTPDELCMIHNNNRADNKCKDIHTSVSNLYNGSGCNMGGNDEYLLKFSSELRKLRAPTRGPLSRETEDYDWPCRRSCYFLIP